MPMLCLRIGSQAFKSLTDHATKGFETLYKRGVGGHLLGYRSKDGFYVSRAVPYNTPYTSRTAWGINQYNFRKKGLRLETKRVKWIGTYHSHVEISRSASTGQSREDKEAHLFFDAPVDIILRITTCRMRAPEVCFSYKEKRDSHVYYYDICGYVKSTKLSIPPARKDLVVRPRLIDRLNAGLQRRLTLLSTPAGFGKTTLLSAWAFQCNVPVAWLPLDEGDIDPARFLDYLQAALDQVGVETALEDGRRSTVPQGVFALLSDTINRIAAFDRQLALVFDDYHHITAEPVHGTLSVLLEHLPDNLHLFVATRADPPFPISRLRGRGQLVELHLTDLRFHATEAETFLNQVMRLGLVSGDVEALLSRTEGWIAGLQMAAISRQDRQEPSRFIQAFTGSHRFVLDYLMEEVLQGRSTTEQDFLLKTSILEQMCGPLCEAVVSGLANGEGQAILQRLERSNLFVLPLDDQRIWYRYHRLFADLLARQLSQAMPGQVKMLHERASAWFEANGLLDFAIDHALVAEDFERAGRLNEFPAEEMLMRSQFATLSRWVGSLPEEVLLSRPLLHLYYAWALLFSGQPISDIEARLGALAREPGISPGQLAPLWA